MLSERERRVLEDISTDLELHDPEFAALLAGERRDRWRRRVRAGNPIVAAAAIPVGLAVTVATFPISTPLAFAGTAAAFWGCATHASRFGSAAERLRNLADGAINHRRRGRAR